MRYSMFIPGFVLAIALSQARAEPPGTGRAAPCQATQITATITTPSGNDPFQQESLLVLRNTGQTACLLPPLRGFLFPLPVFLRHNPLPS